MWEQKKNIPPTSNSCFSVNFWPSSAELVARLSSLPFDPSRSVISGSGSLGLFRRLSGAPVSKEALLMGGKVAKLNQMSPVKQAYLGVVKSSVTSALASTIDLARLNLRGGPELA